MKAQVKAIFALEKTKQTNNLALPDYSYDDQLRASPVGADPKGPKPLTQNFAMTPKEAFVSHKSHTFDKI